jgi:outer membrane protein TolC
MKPLPLPLLLVAVLSVASGLPSVACAVEVQTLGGNVESLLEFARERHPEFAVMRHEAAAAAARVAPAGALPDPVFGVELRDFTNEIKGGSANVLPARVAVTRYTINQSLPWFGKRDLKREIATAGAGEAEGRAGAIWADLAWQIKQTYAQHHVHAATIQYRRENLTLLDQLAQIAQARYAGGLVPQQDVIRAQTERTVLQSELAMLEGENEQAAARMRTLLGRPAAIRLLPPERLRPLPSAAKLEIGALETRIVERNPRLAADAARIDGAEKARELTYKNRYPDFNVGLASMQEGNRVASWDLMFEVNIPLQQESRRAQELEAERMLDAAKSRKEATLNQTLAELAESLAALHASRRVEDLVRTSLLPQSELTLQSALAGYATGKVDFATVLDAQRQIRRAQEDLVRARANQQMRLADIERVIGGEL